MTTHYCDVCKNKKEKNELELIALQQKIFKDVTNIKTIVIANETYAAIDICPTCRDQVETVMANKIYELMGKNKCQEESENSEYSMSKNPQQKNVENVES